MKNSPLTVGVISDTHGLLRPVAVEALRGVDRLIHAGDRSEWAERLPLTETVQVIDTRLYVIHDVKELDLDPRAASIRAVISGHSHQASIREENGVLYLNPGSAGPRRFKLPLSVALLEIDGEGRVAARLIELPI